MKKPTVKSENELLPNWNYDDVSSGRSNVLKVREFNCLRGPILYKIRTILRRHDQLSSSECILNDELWANECVKLIAKRIYELHKWNDGSSINLLGVPCIGRHKFRLSVRHFSLAWDGLFECPDYVSGKATGFKSRSSAIQHAIQEFLVNNQFSDEQKGDLLNLL